MNQKNFLKIALFFLLISNSSFGQFSITSPNTNFTIDFDNTLSGVNNGQFAGSGFQATPTAGQLDSDAWNITGFSDGNLAFGGTNTSGDYARGNSNGNVTSGGIYAFLVSSGNRAFGVQPAGSDFIAPGTITLLVNNNSGVTINSITISYEIWVRNDQGRSNSFNFSYSTDNSAYSNIASLNYTSGTTADASPTWVSNSRSTTINSLNIPNNSAVYLRWSGADVGGSGSRDEFALDNIIVNMSYSSTTWTGTIDSDWSKTGNWLSGVPTSTIDASIPNVTNAPIISGSTNAVVKNLTISEPDGVTVNSGGTLIVSGTSSGNVTYNRNLGTTNWYLVSSPVSGQAYNDAYVTTNNIASGTGNNRGIASFTTLSNSWSYLQAGGSGSFANGSGYSVKKSTAGDISFTGTINTTDVSVAVANTGTGFNLLGNPYTAYLNSVSFLTANVANLASQDIWVWNQSTNNYEVKNLVDAFVLAPAQGFFVKAATALNLTIAKSSQAATGNAFQKTSKPEITLNMTDGSNNRFAKIYYLDNATTGFDNGYDGETFGGIENKTDVFTHLVANSAGKKYQIQSLPNDDFENSVIPVGVKAAAGKELSFTAEANAIPNGIKVYLEDKIANKVTVLSEADASYKVTLTESLDGIGRFYLHTKASGVLSTETIKLDNISVYTTNASTIKVVGLSQEKATIKLFSILGKQVFETSFKATNANEIQIPVLSSGIYLVRLSTKKGFLNKKITIH